MTAFRGPHNWTRIVGKFKYAFLHALGGEVEIIHNFLVRIRTTAKRRKADWSRTTTAHFQPFCTHEGCDPRKSMFSQESTEPQ